MNQYPDRDLVGYGPKPPNPDWPSGARLAVNFVLNGDEHSETALSDLSALEPLHGTRHLNIESCYEYGSRVGVWRIFDAFAERDMPITVYAVGLRSK